MIQDQNQDSNTESTSQIKAESHFHLMDVFELMELKEPNFLIEEVLYENSLTVLYGAPGSGKSFIALSIALALACDISWLNKKVITVPVLYVAAEGVSGLKFRVKAFKQHHAIPEIHKNIKFIGTAVDFLKPAENLNW